MRARTLLAAPALALLLLPGQSGAAGSAARPTAVGIAQREFHITAYRRSVPTGPVKLNIRNFGEDTHNLIVRGPKRFLAVGPDVDSGANASWTVKLKRPGTYQLICTRADHLSLGMRTRLKVVRSKRASSR